MRTLDEIIEETKDGGRPEYDELRYALVAMCGLHWFVYNNLLDLAERERTGKYNPKMFGLEWASNERFKNFKTAMAMSPKEYVGDSFDPDSDTCKEMRKFSKGILNKFNEMKKKEEDKNEKHS
jgi:hypothetical protein